MHPSNLILMPTLEALYDGSNLFAIYDRIADKYDEMIDER